VNDLPTVRTLADTGFMLVVWCKACWHQEELPFGKLVDQGLGDRTAIGVKLSVLRVDFDSALKLEFHGVVSLPTPDCWLPRPGRCTRGAPRCN
jgi:hypothetical protein